MMMRESTNSAILRKPLLARIHDGQKTQGKLEMSRIYISYRRGASSDYAKRLYLRLAQYYGDDNIFMDIEIGLGVNFVTYINEIVQQCDVLLAVIDRDWLTITDDEGQCRLDDPNDFVRTEIAAALNRNIPVIPLYVRESKPPSETRLPAEIRRLTQLQGLHLSDLRFDQHVVRLIQALDTLFLGIASESLRSNSAKVPNFTLIGVELVNIRCFQEFHLNLEEGENTIRWAMILGDNAAGKTTLLRGIALGLCRESEAVTLMQEIPGDFIRQGEEEGRITVRLRESKRSDKTYTITTSIQKTPDAASEIIRQKTDPPTGFPWADIFVCGYGTHRATQANTSYEHYSVLQAVQSLFNYQAALQNPEVILLRQASTVRSQMERKLLQVLMLDAPDDGLNTSQSGLELKGPWGRLPLAALSDGYRSTAQWVLDFIGWLIYAHRFLGNPDIGGILLIDELEQHLHPRWQRFIVQRLRQQFPTTQIIATTHTPLTASGVVDVAPSLLLRLEQDDDGMITKRVIDTASLAGKRADQVLASEAFGLVTTRNPGSEDDFDRYATLLGKATRTEGEETEFQELGLRLRQALQSSENEVAQVVEQAVDDALNSMLHNLSPERLDLETKRQLREIFRPEMPE